MNIAQIIKRASEATGAYQHVTAGFDLPNAIIPTRAASGGVFNLQDALPEITLDAHTPIAAVVEHSAGRAVPLSAAIARNSRVCAAGARLVVVDPIEQALPIGATGDVAMQRRAQRFSVVEAAEFGLVADGDNATVSALPFTTTEISLADEASHAVRFEISRSDLRSLSESEINFAAMTSLALGLADLVDRLTLDEILAQNVPAFSLEAAATRGLRFPELRAIAGKAGASAEVGHGGILRVAGVPAELCAAVDPSIIGSFARAGVAIDHEIRVIVDRLGLSGGVNVTAFVNVQPLIPDATAFWQLPAPVVVPEE